MSTSERMLEKKNDRQILPSTYQREAILSCRLRELRHPSSLSTTVEPVEALALGVFYSECVLLAGS